MNIGLCRKRIKMNQCQRCKKWTECPGVPEWFNPSDIRFCPYQVRWILDNVESLGMGRWPMEPKISGYIDRPGNRRIKSEAHFVVPVGVLAEVHKRLSFCGQDGALVRCLSQSVDIDVLKDLVHLSDNQINNRVNRAIRYASGWRRRRLSYYEFSRRNGISESHRRVE